MRRSKIRAPKLDGQFVVTPDSDLASLIDQNKLKLSEGDAQARRGFSNRGSSAGESFAELRSRARQDLLIAALNHTEKYVPECRTIHTDSESIVLTGHQPELFHPGVWFKNFLLDQIGQQQDCTAINLLIDNDESHSGIAVPSGTIQQPVVEQIEFSATQSGVPFENHKWQSDDASDSFVKKVSNAMGQLIPYECLLPTYWRHVMNAKENQSNIGICLAEARHRLELDHGVKNLEVPLSVVCQSHSFAEFATFLLDNAETFFQVYNRSLQTFRSVNKIRSNSHPVPSLVRQDGWTEMPFWIWSRNSVERKRLFVRSSRDKIELSDLGPIVIALPRAGLVNAVYELESHQGISIRPRALITTMFARVFLSDLFIHGIGGAKYDELTDLLIEEFLGFSPPGYLTATSTHLLPLEFVPFDEEALRRLEISERELRFHPEKSLPQKSEFQAAVQRKKRMLAEIPPRGEKKDWHNQLDNINRKLLEPQQARLKALAGERERLLGIQARSRILCSREYSFVLHPLNLVERLCTLSQTIVRTIAHCNHESD